MKKTIVYLIILIGMIFCCNRSGYGQEHKCQIETQQGIFFKTHPKAYQEHIQSKKAQNALIKNLKSAKLKSANSQKYIIPVVFHVFGSYQSGKLVDFELIKDALQRTNNDFAGISTGQNQIHTRFEDIVDCIDIEFRLAQIDTQGNICTGVMFYPEVSGFGNGNNYDDKIQKYAWDNEKYMNVYIMNDLYDDGDLYNSGVAWYPNKRMSDNQLSRVVYNGRYLGNNTNDNFRRILTHEFGHFFNLAHTFSGGCPESGGGDNCNDTPAAGDSHMGINEKNCEGNYTNTQNFMNYTDDYQMFTQDQVIRMEAAMQHSSRITLWQNDNLIATGVNNGFDAGESVVYNSFIFEEDFSNEGNISTTLTASLIGGVEYTNETFVANTHYKIYNVPQGLNVTITRTTETKASIEITGAATNHELNNSITDLTIEFLQGAFTLNIDEIKSTHVDNFAINFLDKYTQYCTPQSEYQLYAGISNIKFANINNTSAVVSDGTYNNYSENYIAQVNLGETYDLSVTLNKYKTGASDSYIILAWLDYNGDFMFDSDELIMEHSMTFTDANNKGDYTFTKQVIIPMNATTEKYTGLRIFTKFKTGDSNLDSNDPCAVFESGELEDYGVAISSVILSVEQPAAVKNIKVFPNPVSSILTVQSDNSLIHKVRLITSLGQVILVRNKGNSNRVNINVENLNKGLYVVEVTTEDSRQLFKIVK